MYDAIETARSSVETKETEELDCLSNRQLQNNKEVDRSTCKTREPACELERIFVQL